jgi:hypothetical protein
MRRTRRVKREPMRWENDWRNPDCKVLRNFMEPAPWGGYVRVTEEVTAEESRQICQESIDTSDTPTWKKDKYY